MNEATKEGYRFSTLMEIRFRDVDAMGHVNNAVYFTYLEQTRVDYVRAAGLVSKDATFPGGIGFILAEAHCQFKSPAYFGERLRIWARVPGFRRSSFPMEYAIHSEEDGRLVVLAETVQVMFNYREKKVIPIPRELMETLGKIEDRDFVGELARRKGRHPPGENVPEG